MERSLDMIVLLKKRNKCEPGEKLVTEFLLSEQLYSKATINPSNTVYLWLGVSLVQFSVNRNDFFRSESSNDFFFLG